MSASGRASTSVGIRELRQRVSELLRLVEAGETIEVTDRGRPVALLTPRPGLSALDRLRAAGDVEPATARLEDLPPPIPIPPGQDPPSVVLARLRRPARGRVLGQSGAGTRPDPC